MYIGGMCNDPTVSSLLGVGVEGGCCYIGLVEIINKWIKPLLYIEFCYPKLMVIAVIDEAQYSMSLYSMCHGF